MRNLIYKKCEVRSTPRRLVDDKEFSHAVNGVIIINLGSEVIDVMTEALNIPDAEWRHKSEESADDVFVKYARIYLDNNT